MKYPPIPSTRSMPLSCQPADRAARLPMLGHGQIEHGLWLSLLGVDQRLAHVDDVDYAKEASVARDWQVTEMPGRHDFGCVPDACCGGDGRAGGHHGTDPDAVVVFPICDGAGDVCLGEDTGRLA